MNKIYCAPGHEMCPRLMQRGFSFHWPTLNGDSPVKVTWQERQPRQRTEPWPCSGQARAQAVSGSLLETTSPAPSGIDCARMVQAKIAAVD